MRYCLVQCYGDDFIDFCQVPDVEPDPEVGAEADQYEYLDHFEGGVVTAVIGSESEDGAGRALSLIESLDKAGQDDAFRLQFMNLIILAVQGSEATTEARAETKQYFDELKRNERGSGSRRPLHIV